jgi:hypothetical protein
MMCRGPVTCRRHALVQGAEAGLIGGMLMSVSTNAEMRLRGRPPSRLPAQALERIIPIDLNRRQEQQLVTVGHILSSASLGMIRGLLSVSGLSRARAHLTFIPIAFLPDFVLMPLSGSTPEPWRWKPVEILTSAIHHSVYSLGTVAAYEWLQRRDRR